MKSIINKLLVAALFWIVKTLILNSHNFRLGKRLLCAKFNLLIQGND